MSKCAFIPCVPNKVREEDIVALLRERINERYFYEQISPDLHKCFLRFDLRMLEENPKYKKMLFKIDDSAGLVNPGFIEKIMHAFLRLGNAGTKYRNND